MPGAEPGQAAPAPSGPAARGEAGRAGHRRAGASRGNAVSALGTGFGGLRSETFHTLRAGKKPPTTISHEHLPSASHRKRSEMISSLAFCSRQGQLLRSDQVAQGFIHSHLAKPSKGGGCRAALGNPCLSGLDMEKGFLLFSYHLPCLNLFLAHHCEDPGSIFMMVSCQALRAAIMYLLSLQKAEQAQLSLLIFKNKCSPSLTVFVAVHSTQNHRIYRVQFVSEWPVQGSNSLQFVNISLLLESPKPSALF